MYWYFILLRLLLLFAAGASTSIALFAWKRRPVPGSIPFAVASLAITQWSLAFVAQISASSLTEQIMWAKFQSLGVAILPIAWLLFALEYSGRKRWLTVRRALLLGVVPFLSCVLALTNEYHGLVWGEVSTTAVHNLQILAVTPAAWYWVNIIFLYGCHLAGALLILNSDQYEIAALLPRQAFVLIAGLILPWFGLTLQVIGLNVLSLMPLAFAISAIVVAVYALRLRVATHRPLERYSLFNNLDDGLLVLNKGQYVVDANVAASQALERPFAHLVGQPLTAVWPELAAQFHRLQERPLDFIRVSDGVHHFYEVRLSALYDWRKTASTYLLLMHDITRRKEQETLREDITHSMVHDLRSPISNSLFALQMLKGTLAEDDASADSQQLVDMTFANTEKVLRLVNNILDVNQLENGRIPIKPSHICLNTLAEQVITAHSAYALEKDIKVECLIAPNLPPAWADVGLVERVLQNLLHNSLKFTPVGGHIWITAVLSAVTPGIPAHLEISVHDDGPGLPPALQDVIFDKFVTGDSKQSGNGLGLTFCQMALAAHGERIWVHSVPGQGATFTFTLSPTHPAALLTDTKATPKTAVPDPVVPLPLNGARLSRPHPKMAFLNR